MRRCSRRALCTAHACMCLEHMPAGKHATARSHRSNSRRPAAPPPSAAATHLHTAVAGYQRAPVSSATKVPTVPARLVGGRRAARRCSRRPSALMMSSAAGWRLRTRRQAGVSKLQMSGRWCCRAPPLRTMGRMLSSRGLARACGGRSPSVLHRGRRASRWPLRKLRLTSRASSARRADRTRRSSRRGHEPALSALFAAHSSGRGGATSRPHSNYACLTRYQGTRVKNVQSCCVAGR